MKKMILGLCALFACFVMTSCGAGDPKENVAKIEEATKKLEKAKTASDVADAAKEGLKACADFFEGDPTADQVKEYEEKFLAFGVALKGVEKNLDKDEMKKLEDDKDLENEIKELQDKIEKAADAWKEKHKDDKKDGEKEDKE